jgi:hypothetical protein
MSIRDGKEVSTPVLMPLRDMEESPEAMGLARRPLLQDTQSQTIPGDDLELQQWYSRSGILALLVEAVVGIIT